MDVQKHKCRRQSEVELKRYQKRTWHVQEPPITHVWVTTCAVRLRLGSDRCIVSFGPTPVPDVKRLSSATLRKSPIPLNRALNVPLVLNGAEIRTASWPW